jgi:hypothetical protein
MRGGSDRSGATRGRPDWSGGDKQGARRSTTRSHRAGARERDEVWGCAWLISWGRTRCWPVGWVGPLGPCDGLLVHHLR